MNHRDKLFLIRTVWAIIVVGINPMQATDVRIGGLCPNIVASLTPYLGDPSQTRAGQRVEVRQCPLSSFNSEIGLLQFVAWEKNAATPSLIIDTELRALNQLVMVPGAYAFETVSASSTGVIGIVFENGKPRQAVRDSTKGRLAIRSDRNSILIELDDGDGRKRNYVLKAEK